MDPNPAAAASSDSPSSSSNTAASLKALNKSSYKISKPTSAAGPRTLNPSISNPLPPFASSLDSSSASSHPAPPPPQPPVYNIDKSNFRDIVQKLTGSPAHILSPSPPPPPAARPSSLPSVPSFPQAGPTTTSRLHRIRPPPLPSLAGGPRAMLPPPPPSSGIPATLSPLPPLPAVCMTAESPVSAYMRQLRSGGVGQGSSAAGPPSPLGFGGGCLPSPRTSYQMIPPTSPGVPMPATSPRHQDQ